MADEVRGIGVATYIGVVRYAKVFDVNARRYGYMAREGHP
jgi:hypothetical protein